MEIIETLSAETNVHENFLSLAALALEGKKLR